MIDKINRERDHHIIPSRRTQGNHAAQRGRAAGFAAGGAAIAGERIMPTFVFRGVNQFGAVVAGKRSANNREDLVAALGRQHVRLTKVTEKPSRLGLGALAAALR